MVLGGKTIRCDCARAMTKDMLPIVKVLVFRMTVGHRVLGKCSTQTLTPLIERVKTRSGVGRREKLNHSDTIGGTHTTRTPGQ